jgi:regulator of nucleoside diphosphate kinase
MSPTKLKVSEMGLIWPDVLLCPEDHRAICQEIAAVRPTDGTQLLAHEVGRARLVPRERLPTDTVRLNSTVEFLDNDVLEIEAVQVVLIDRGRPLDEVPVTSPLGAALIGLKVGDTMNWVSRDQGARAVTITRVTNSRGRQAPARR